MERAAERRKSPLQQAQERDGLITDISGPYWATLLVLMGLFPNYEKAAKRIRKLHRQRLIYFLGKCPVRHGQRDSFIYGNHRVKEDNLHHEVTLSLMLALFYRVTKVLRLYDVDPALRPDATMVLEGITYHWEYHTGTVGLAQMKDRLKLYEPRDCVLLFVAKKEKHLAKIHPIAEALKDKIFFATLDDVLKMKTPWDKAFWSYDGRRVGITEPGQHLDHVAG